MTFFKEKYSIHLRRPSMAVAAAVLLLGVPVILASAALYLDITANYSFPMAQGVAAVLGLAFLGTGMALLIFGRPCRISCLLVVAALFMVLIWWSTLLPRNDRAWLPDVAKPAWSEINGDQLIVHNLRNFDYRSETDYQEVWETREYDLASLKGVDVFFCYWGPTMIAHNIASWQFADGRQLAISIETRKEKGEEYSAIRSFFRQFELYYVVADERDVIRIRTNYRGERLFLYQTTLTAGEARKLLLDYLENINRLVQEPAWYNAVTMNCITTIWMHLKHTNLAQHLDWRLIVNGYADRLAYDRGFIDNKLPFDELRRLSEITETAKKTADNPDFAKMLRQVIPTSRK